MFISIYNRKKKKNNSILLQIFNKMEVFFSLLWKGISEASLFFANKQKHHIAKFFLRIKKTQSKEFIYLYFFYICIYKLLLKFTIMNGLYYMIQFNISFIMK